MPETFLSAVVLGELYFGAAKSGRPEANIARIANFAATSTVLKIDAATALQYGQLRNDLRRKGRPIPENDVWIAAGALLHGMVLITRDHHFQYVDDLRLEAW